MIKVYVIWNKNSPPNILNIENPPFYVRKSRHLYMIMFRCMCVLLFQDLHHISYVNYDIVDFQNCLKFIINWSKFIIFKRFRFLVYEPLLRSQEKFSQDSDLFATELMWDPAEHLVSLAENQNLENTNYMGVFSRNRP